MKDKFSIRQRRIIAEALGYMQMNIIERINECTNAQEKIFLNNKIVEAEQLHALFLVDLELHEDDVREDYMKELAVYLGI